MENQSLQFRTAMFGGFQKQDVLNYLERSTREHAEKLADLQKKLKEAQDGQGESETQTAACRTRLEALEEENGRLTEELAGREESLAMSIKRCDELEAKISDLKAQLEALEPAAEAYQELKDRAAGIELAAHARAQAIEEASSRKVERAERELLARIDQARAVYATLRTDLSSALSTAAEELQRTEERMRGMSGELMGWEDPLGAVRGMMESARPQADSVSRGTQEAVETGLFGRLRPTPPPEGPSPFTK